VWAGNAYAGWGSGLCHRKLKLLPASLGQHTFGVISALAWTFESSYPEV
jgi:hypothetical protein